jgi:hypothetical protein
MFTIDMWFNLFLNHYTVPYIKTNHPWGGGYMGESY